MKKRIFRSAVILLMIKSGLKTSEKTSNACPFRSFLIPLNLTWVLINSLCCNKISLLIPLGFSQIDGVANVYEGFYGAIKETVGFQRHKNFGRSGAWEA
jgi:hypothetical protein